MTNLNRKLKMEHCKRLIRILLLSLNNSKKRLREEIEEPKIKHPRI